MFNKSKLFLVGLIAGGVTVLAGCAGTGGASESQVPRLIIDGTSHKIGSESYCHYQTKKIRAYSEAADFESSGTKMSIFITPDESRSEIAIYPGNDGTMASGHGTWDTETNEGVFDGGMQIKIEDDVLTLSGLFESAVIDDFEIEADYAVECTEEP